ncbi:NAD-dependent epimerase/dehydratase family protein [Candidatus Woesearchaeota archaeon]|nr:NAD-dependent epimerase/dehydratase family protein [Candidatus Woesearchaeota archaeon]
MRILVTGGAGFLGSHLVDALAKGKSNKIAIFDNLHRGRLENINQHRNNKNITFVEGDIRNPIDLKKIGNIDFVYHLAAQSNVIGSVSTPGYAFSTNVVGTLNVLKFASEKKVKRFIFSSSREVYGNPEYLPVDESHPLNPINMYGITKLCGETLCNAFSKNKNLNLTILRIANSYGSRDRDRAIPVFLENAKKNKDLTLFGGKQVLDFICIEDVINAMIKISNEDKFIGEIINIGTGTGTSIQDLAKSIIKLTHSKSKIIRKESRHFDVEKFVAKSNKIRLTTTRLIDGLKKTIEYY